MRFLTALLVVLASAVSVSAGPVEHGRALADEFCGPCHAVGRKDRSPHAAAPALRELGKYYDLDALPHRLMRGISASHPEMPVVKFRPRDARDLRAYLRTIQD